MVYIMSGSVTVATGTAEKVLQEGETIGIRIDMIDEPVLFSPKEHVRLLLLSGENTNDPIAAYGPFIMNTQEELAEAFERYRAGKMGRLDAVHASSADSLSKRQ